jgi:hypothetical protein
MPQQSRYQGRSGIHRVICAGVALSVWLAPMEIRAQRPAVDSLSQLVGVLRTFKVNDPIRVRTRGKELIRGTYADYVDPVIQVNQPQGSRPVPLSGVDSVWSHYNAVPRWMLGGALVIGVPVGGWAALLCGAGQGEQGEYANCSMATYFIGGVAGGAAIGGLLAVIAGPRWRLRFP